MCLFPNSGNEACSPARPVAVSSASWGLVLANTHTHTHKHTHTHTHLPASRVQVLVAAKAHRCPGARTGALRDLQTRGSTLRWQPQLRHHLSQHLIGQMTLPVCDHHMEVLPKAELIILNRCNATPGVSCLSPALSLTDVGPDDALCACLFARCWLQLELRLQPSTASSRPSLPEGSRVLPTTLS